jgi:hypothetical protein
VPRRPPQSAPLPPLTHYLDENEIPNGLVPLQYADFVLEKASIVSGFGLRERMSKVIVTIAKTEHVEGPEATRRLLERVLAAQEAGETVNVLWIDDSRWRPQARASPRTAAEKRAAKLAAFMAKGD